MYHPKPWHTVTRFVQMWSYPTIVIAVLGYCFLVYWWLLSLLTMFPVAYPDFAPDIQGLLMIGLILGTVISEVLVSGRLSDWIVIKLAQRNGNIRTPEMRLWLWYPATIFVMIGLIVWGKSIDAGWHWITGQIAWFLCNLHYLSEVYERSCLWDTDGKYCGVKLCRGQLPYARDGSHHILFRDTELLCIRGTIFHQYLG